MAKIKKKGTSGQAKNFITRTQAVRKLQISLPDFRQLCIFKGIFPREPRSRKKASKTGTPSTVFFYSKDIQFLLHDPLLAKFRDQHALAKKIGRALGRGEVQEAARLEKYHTPHLSLDHVIKERYPTFVDALRDLDDALTMIFLFANLPTTSHVSSKQIALCQRLSMEFEHYLIVTHSLRKSFLSIKGIYYQAEIQGQEILWVVPHKFVQQVTADVDFRIMATFVKFYTTLLGFVNFRLYSSARLVYPPKFNEANDEKGAELNAFVPQGRDFSTATSIPDSGAGEDSKVNDEATARAQAIVNSLPVDNGEEEDDTAVFGATDEASDAENEDELIRNPSQIARSDTQADDAVLLAESSEAVAKRSANLFKPYFFWISREAPRGPLEFILRAFGCDKIGWDEVQGAGALTTDEQDSRITHQIVDRPPIPVSNLTNEESRSEAAGTLSGRIPGRTYVQPQWVWDSVNALVLQRPDLYGPGATLPPHFSPFVKPKHGAYDPTAPLDEVSGDEDEEDEENALQEVPESNLLTNGSETGEGLVEEDESSPDGSEDDAAEPSSKRAGNNAKGDLEWEGLSDDDEASAYQRELEAEATGKPAPRPKTLPTEKKAKKKLAATREAEWEVERRKMMLPRRKRKLYEKMQSANAKVDEEAERLKAKRRRIEKQSGSVRT